MGLLGLLRLLRLLRLLGLLAIREVGKIQETAWGRDWHVVLRTAFDSEDAEIHNWNGGEDEYVAFG